MKTNVKIFFSRDFSQRSYVYFYHNQKRIRIYNAKQFGIVCNPNNQVTEKTRFKALIKLEEIVLSQLENGWLTGQKIQYLGDSLLQIRQEIIASSYSTKYIRDCRVVIDELIDFTKLKSIDGVPLVDLKSTHVEQFLTQFNSSNAYYVIKRRTLSAVFQKMILKGWCLMNPVRETSIKRVEAVQNVAFSDKQLELTLKAIQSTNDNFYLCVLFVYCMLLRPHKEVRLLKRSNFNEDLTILTLSGSENKSKRIRSIPVPERIRTLLLQRGVLNLPDEFNIFTQERTPLNECYFSTCWSRVKRKLLVAGIITVNHTLYSFRHSAVCSVFKRSNDLHLVQRLCSHQSMVTSLKYLRSLGMEQVGTLDELPQLEF